MHGLLKYGTAALFWTLLAVNVSFAQNIRKGEVTIGESQETYVPEFKIDGKHGKVRNVILMIGDGMGLAHVSAAMFANGGSLNMTNLRTMGYVRTQSASDFTTDSAASGTAYATGSKTSNRVIGLDPDGNRLSNIVDILSVQGYATGILSTDYMDGCTPAAFFAHQKDRGMSKEIWSDLASSLLNFASAGCRDAYEKLPEAVRTSIGDSFDVVYSLADVSPTSKLVYFPERGECDSVNNPERADFLPATTSYAIEYLEKLSKKGFFLMVEGARIDKSSHSNDFPAMVEEVLDFDKAVENAIRFAEKDGHTLVIISADHETGAVSLRRGNVEKGYVSGLFASGGHTPVMVPLFAYGPWSDLFMGVQENSDIPGKILSILLK